MLKELVETALKISKQRIRQFSKVNNICLDERILSIPAEEIKEYLSKRGYGKEDSEEHISEEEIREDLGDSEAYILEYDEATEMPFIIYDGEKIYEESEDGRVEIFTHEYLHYADICGEDLKFNYKSFDELEAEVEVLALIITFYSKYSLSEGLDRLSERYNTEIEEDSEFTREFNRKLYDLDFERVKKRLSCKLT